MAEQTIQCSKCGAQIPLTEALTGQIEQGIRLKYEAEAARKDRLLQEKLGELERQRQSLEAQVAQKVRAERTAIVEAERKRILGEQAEEKRAMEAELAEKNRKLLEMQRQEIELRKRQRDIEQKQQELELENQRTLDAERRKIAEEASRKAAEDNLLKLRERDDKIDLLMQQISELKRKAEVGSQEAQGEALEGVLLDQLRMTYVEDVFEEVKKGQAGGDIVQLVRNRQLSECGRILWECKYTKNFSKDWIGKLKADQQAVGAEAAVIATAALPKEIRSFGLMDGVWVTDFASAMGLTMALRIGLINTARERRLTANQDLIKDRLYHYMKGPEFHMQIRGITDAFKVMQEDLGRERRAMEKLWKSREKQIETVLMNTASIQGALQGTMGPRLEAGGSGLAELEAMGE